MKPVLVAGIGNVLMGDDGIGPALVNAIVRQGQIPANVDVEDLGTPGLELAGYLASRRAVIVVDSLRSASPAGTVHILGKAEILTDGYRARTGPHATSLAASLRGLDFAGAAPKAVTLVGIAGLNWNFGQGLSLPVAHAIGPAQRLIRALISCACRDCCCPGNCDQTRIPAEPRREPPTASAFALRTKPELPRAAVGAPGSCE